MTTVRSGTWRRHPSRLQGPCSSPACPDGSRCGGAGIRGSRVVVGQFVRFRGDDRVHHGTVPAGGAAVGGRLGPLARQCESLPIDDVAPLDEVTPISSTPDL